MSAKNVKTLRAAHESWNERDFAGVIRNAAENIRPLYVDRRPPRYRTIELVDAMYAPIVFTVLSHKKLIGESQPATARLPDCSQ